MNKHSVGIDTSNYTTSAARYDGERVLENRKLLLPVKPGEKGLRQSDAVFHHVKQLPQVLEPILEMGPAGVVGVSITPRSEMGSYMPCFLVGKGFACTLGAAWGVGVKFFSHQEKDSFGVVKGAEQQRIEDIEGNHVAQEHFFGHSGIGEAAVTAGFRRIAEYPVGIVPTLFRCGPMRINFSHFGSQTEQEQINAPAKAPDFWRTFLIKGFGNHPVMHGEANQQTVNFPLAGSFFPFIKL